MKKERVQINLRISKEKKELFQRAADEIETSVTDLIKTATTREAKKILNEK